MKCPVCNAPMNSLICGCGYDASRDYGKYPAFGTVRDVLPFSVLRSRPTPKNALVCEKCGSAAFSIAVPEGTRRCAKCGWSPDEAPRLECGCGSVYFTARLSDGALLCPLCGKAVSLEDYLKRVRPKISSPQLHVPPEVPAAPQVLPDSSETPYITAIAAGSAHTVVLYSNGRVRATGDNGEGQCNVQRWSGIVAIAAGDKHTVGLKKDGTVVTAGASVARRTSDNHCCAVENWRDITAIAAGASYTLGLRKDGTIAAAGSNYHAQHAARNTTGVRAIFAGPRHVAFLRSDGQVLSGNYSAETLQTWRNVTQLALGSDHIVALTKSGTTLSAGYNAYGQRFVNWTNIQAIAAGDNHTLGLRKNGTVASAGDNRAGQCNTQGWTDIVAIAAGRNHSVGLKKDGTLVAVGEDTNGCCSMEKLRL